MEKTDEEWIEIIKKNMRNLKSADWIPEEVLRKHIDVILEKMNYQETINEYVNLPEWIKEEHLELSDKVIEDFIFVKTTKIGAISYLYEGYDTILDELPKNYTISDDTVRKLYSIDNTVWDYIDEESAIRITKEELEDNVDSIKYIPEKVLKKCPRECIEFLTQNITEDAFEYIPEEIVRQCPEQCLEAIKNRIPLIYIPEEIQLKYSKTCLNRLLKQKKDFYIMRDFEQLSDKIKLENPDICVYVIKKISENQDERDYYNENLKSKILEIVESIPRELWKDIEFYKKITELFPEMYIGEYERFMSNIPEEMLNDKNFIEEIYKKDRRVLFCTNDDIREEILNKDKGITIGADWQEKCIEQIKDKNNVILSSPTGSGKTRVFLEWAKQKQERPIYITAPIKALSNQRWRELQEQGYVVGLETGDIKYLPENCDFICCTQEIYTGKYAEQENATLIMDEFHYIFENSDRARTYIEALNNSKAKNILLCSATMGKMDKLKEYIEMAANREFTAYENKERLTRLRYGLNIPRKNIENALVITFSKKNIDTILYWLSYDRLRKPGEDDKKRIDEIHKIAEKYKISKDGGIIDYAEKGLAGYYGGLLPKEKLFIEECFENRLIDTVVGTDALAMGVNFPVENVVFTQLVKYKDGSISKNLFDQLAGRAGRKGYYEIGNVYYCDDISSDIEARGYSTEVYYKGLVLDENESISVELKPNMKKILTKERTIDEEAKFIMKYSTKDLKYEDIVEEIESNIHNIEYFAEHSMIRNIIDEEFGEDDYDDIEWYQYDELLDDELLDDEERHYLEEKKRNMEERSEAQSKRWEELKPLEKEFKENIVQAYFDEYDTYKNCLIFADIIQGKGINELMWKYGERFNDMLQLRKYIMNLPVKYRRNLDITILDDEINSIDQTVFNLDRGKVTVQDIKQATREEQLDADGINKVFNNMEKQMQTEEKEQNINRS